MRANQIVKGDRRDPKNTFKWDHIEENVSCSKTYVTHPEVQKVRKDGDIASDIIQYVDNVRTLTSTEEYMWPAQSKMGEMLSYLGLQDAACKQHMGSRRSGA